MNKPIEDPVQLARFILEKGKKVHQRIDRLVWEIMMTNNMAMKHLTVVQAEVIMTVHQAGALSITALSEILHVSAPSVSTMVERLVDKNFLLRIPDSRDRRKVSVQLSPHTKKQIEHVEQAILDMFTGLINKIGPDMGNLWRKVLIAVDDTLDNHPELAKPN